jgi:hypothetical protein
MPSARGFLIIEMTDLVILLPVRRTEFAWVQNKLNSIALEQKPHLTPAIRLA